MGQREKKQDKLQCPLHGVHTRIEDAREFWIECHRNYNNPNSFRKHLNVCIQTLRNVTWALQKRKDAIPNFDGWYTKQQDRMRANPSLKWLHDARNYIVKKGDLETLSTAKVKISIEWGAECIIETEINPLLSNEEIAEEIRKKFVLPDEIVEKAILSIERRWTTKELKGEEILETLAECYGFLFLLLEDAHKQIGITGLCDYQRTKGYIGIEKKRREHLQGRVPCMMSTSESRTSWVKMKTGELLHFAEKILPMKPDIAKEARRRYNLDELNVAEGLNTKKLKDSAQYWFEVAKRVVAKDGYHINVAILLGPNPSTVIFKMEEPTDKFAMWNRLASNVESSGASNIIVIGEVFLEAKERGPRRDALQVVAASQEGEVYLFREEFKHGDGAVQFVGEKIEGELIPPGGFLIPIFNVWGKRGKALSSKKEGKIVGWKIGDKIEINVPWFLDASLSCPCGSGKSFKECCEDYLKRKEEKKEIDMSSLEEVEKFYRSELTEYIGFIYRDTLPWIKHAKDEDLSLMIKVDIDTLDGIVRQLASILYEKDKGKEILKVIDHISSFVPLPGLKERMLFLKAIWYDAKLCRPDKAKILLAGVDFEKATDGSLLQLYLQLFGNELAGPKRIELIDRIIEHTEKPAELLQYTTLKGMYLSMGGEADKAVVVLDKAIEEYVPLLQDERDAYSLTVCGDAFVKRWHLKRNEPDLNRALDYYQRIQLEELNECGKAEVYTKIADAYKKKQDFGKAIEYYKKAKEEETTHATIIHLAEVYIRNSELEKGKTILEELEEDEVDEVCKLEYLEVKGLIGQMEDNRDLIQEIIEKARSLYISDPYFQNVREQMCSELERNLRGEEKSEEEGNNAG